jgi:hypothetical protein
LDIDGTQSVSQPQLRTCGAVEECRTSTRLGLRGRRSATAIIGGTSFVVSNQHPSSTHERLAPLEQSAPACHAPNTRHELFHVLQPRLSHRRMHIDIQTTGMAYQRDVLKPQTPRQITFKHRSVAVRLVECLPLQHNYRWTITGDATLRAKCSKRRWRSVPDISAATTQRSLC